jgi:hypothetical protein
MTQRKTVKVPGNVSAQGFTLGPDAGPDRIVEEGLGENLGCFRSIIRGQLDQVKGRSPRALDGMWR